MLTLQGHRLQFTFPDVHHKARCGVEFARTLRVPDDSRAFFWPPLLGTLPVHRVDDHRDRLPAAWGRHGGVFLPLYQAEAIRLNFPEPYPCAIKIAAGKINALTGEPWRNELIPGHQDYLVSSQDSFLDGYRVARRLVRQFVAMPLGEGYSPEEQLTGLAEHGGLQILVYPMKVAAFRARFGARADSDDPDWYREDRPSFMRGGWSTPEKAEMGLAPGGLVQQQTDRDPYGADVWDQTQRGRCFVHLLNSQQYHAVTGTKLPYPPPQRRDFRHRHLPWYHHYSEGEPLEGSGLLATLASVATWFRAKHGQSFPDNDPPGPVEIKPLTARQVREV
jgi:hypothetical protein